MELKDCYSADRFRAVGHAAIDLLADYLAAASQGKLPVMPWKPPPERERFWRELDPKTLQEWLSHYVTESTHLHHPHFLGHQKAVPTPEAALCDFAASLLNTGAATYEMGPSGTVVERQVVQWMASKLGFDDGADGVFTSGGALGNLTGLLAARNLRAPGNVWRDGYQGKYPTVLVSALAHYSNSRAMQIMGMGADGATPVAVDDELRMTVPHLRKALEVARSKNRAPIAVVSNSCSTPTGTFDRIDELADFCEEQGLWLHVDGAHGASAILSPKYRHRLNGIHRADSVCWDTHKLLFMPTSTTAILFRKGENCYRAFEESASPIFGKDEWYDPIHRTLECTKRDLAFKFHVVLKMNGEKFFSDFVTRIFDLAASFATEIERSPDFELATRPESDIVCFRYLPKDVRDLDLCQSRIRRRIMERGNYYLTQIKLPKGVYLRATILNPLTTEKDLQGLLSEVRTAHAETVRTAS